MTEKAAIRPAGAALVLVGVLGTGVASFLPWARSGERLRTSYELVAIAGRLDLLPSSLEASSAAWYLMPLCVLMTWFSVFLGHTRWTTVLALIVGLAAIGLAIVVVGSPLGTEVGTHVGIATGALSVAGAVAISAAPRGGRRDRAVEQQVGHA